MPTTDASVAVEAEDAVLNAKIKKQVSIFSFYTIFLCSSLDTNLLKSPESVFRGALDVLACTQHDLDS